MAALSHFFFAYTEMLKWNVATVRRIAPAWLDGGLDQTSQVAWAAKLAFNVGAYNLVLALGLSAAAWFNASGHMLAAPAALAGAIWLAIAAIAALMTKVVKAFVIQGVPAVLVAIAAAF